MHKCKFNPYSSNAFKKFEPFSVTEWTPKNLLQAKHADFCCKLSESKNFFFWKTKCQQLYVQTERLSKLSLSLSQFWSARLAMHFSAVFLENTFTFILVKRPLKLALSTTDIADIESMRKCKSFLLNPSWEISFLLHDSCPNLKRF